MPVGVCKMQWSFLSHWQLCLLDRQWEASTFLRYIPSSLKWKLRVHSMAATFQVSPPESIHQPPANTEDRVKQGNRKAESMHEGGRWCSATTQLCNGTDLQWEQQISCKKHERLISSPITMGSSCCLIAMGSSFMATRRHWRSRDWQRRCSLSPSVYYWMCTGQRHLETADLCHLASTPPGTRRLPTLSISRGT